MISTLSMFSDPTPPIPDSIDLRRCGVDDLLPEVRGANLVHADPPWVYDNSSVQGNAEDAYGLLSMDDISRHLSYAHDCADQDAYLLVWCTFPNLSKWMTQSLDGWRYITGGAWGKIGRLGVGFHWRGDSEIVLVYAKGKPRPFDRAVSNLHISERTEHSEKPVEFLRSMARAFCPPDGLVLELYAGLGSMARACRAENRRYIGCEIDVERHRRALGFLAGGPRG